MAQFARTYTDFEIMQRTVAQIHWRHSITLLDKVKDKAQRDWSEMYKAGKVLAVIKQHNID